jgi:hypothetical protein
MGGKSAKITSWSHGDRHDGNEHPEKRQFDARFKYFLCKLIIYMLMLSKFGFNASR